MGSLARKIQIVSMINSESHLPVSCEYGKVGANSSKRRFRGEKKNNTTINSTELPVNCPVQSEAHT